MIVKDSVAVVIRDGARILTIRRPEDDNELPGVWVLPAGTALGEETLDDVIRRIGRDKLGVELRPVRKLAFGTQARQKYFLKMELWEVLMEGTPRYPEWEWASVGRLRPGAAAGSLCCELACQAAEKY
jgi:ADP-ribose pyrophosphatase YjhB (NUDIX family)